VRVSRSRRPPDHRAVRREHEGTLVSGSFSRERGERDCPFPVDVVGSTVRSGRVDARCARTLKELTSLRFSVMPNAVAAELGGQHLMTSRSYIASTEEVHPDRRVIVGGVRDEPGPIRPSGEGESAAAARDRRPWPTLALQARSRSRVTTGGEVTPVGQARRASSPVSTEYPARRSPAKEIAVRRLHHLGIDRDQNPDARARRRA